MFLGQHVMKKRSVIIGVIIDKIFIIIFHRILKHNLFPYSFVMSPKIHDKHAFSPGVLRTCMKRPVS